MIKRCAILLGAFTILFGTVPFYNASAATEESTKFSVDVNQAVLELTVPTNPTVIDLNPTMTNASFGTANLTVKVATNNMTGYQLTMTPTNNTEDTSLIRTELVGDEQNYREIETLELTDPISTGYTEQTFTANKWGYKITGDNYYGIDPENATVSHPAWTTSAPTNGTNHNLTLAAKVDADTVSGTYETTLNFRAVTNTVVAKDFVSFDANGGTGTMDSIAVDIGSSRTLPANTFSAPTGMKFVGWSTTQNGRGSGTRYYLDQSVYYASSEGTSITLYAQWNPSDTPIHGGSDITLQRAYEIAYSAIHKGMYEETEPGSGIYEYIDSWNNVRYKGNGRDVRFLIQDMTPEICSSVTVIDDMTLVLDIRDQKSYWIAKLADSSCWMTQNLDLDLVHEDNDANTRYTHDNTDIGWGSDTTTMKWNPERSTIPVTSIDGSGNISGWTNSSTDPYSIDVGDWYWTGEWYDSTTNNYLDVDHSGAGSKFSQTQTSSGLHGHVGNYYNWTAAIASNDSSSYSSSTYSNTSLNPQNSICPAGWRLPIITSYNEGQVGTSEFYNLAFKYGNNTSDDKRITATPLWFIRGGYVSAQSLYSSGSLGLYWSSTVSDNSSYAGVAYGLWFNSSIIFPADNYMNRGGGWPIRCVAR